MNPLPDRITLRCCGCAGEVTFVYPEASERPTFFHTMPACARFNDTNTAMGIERKLPDITGRFVKVGKRWGHVVSCTDEGLVVKIHPTEAATPNKVIEIERSDPGWCLKHPRPSDGGFT